MGEVGILLSTGNKEKTKMGLREPDLQAHETQCSGDDNRQRI